MRDKELKLFLMTINEAALLCADARGDQSYCTKDVK